MKLERNSSSQQAARKRWSASMLVALLFSIISASVAAPFTASAQTAPVGAGFVLDAGDLRFILRQIRIAEAHAAGGQLLGPGANQVNEARLPFGLRTVDGSFNHLLSGQESFGAADEVFTRMVPASFRPGEPSIFGPPTPTTYAVPGTVVDSQPRTISNLIVDQTRDNPAVDAIVEDAAECANPGDTCFIPNVAPDVGLSAGFNSWFTFFGQFFDHGLDLVTKGGGTVFIPLQPGDDLYDADGPDNVPNSGDEANFMVLSRALTDANRDAFNTTTPFVDQNQTYTSHPSHQVFLREYEFSTLRPLPTGRLIDGAIAGNIGNWSEVKLQAALLGIALEDVDVFNVPLLATDAYGHFIPGPNGFPQVVFPGNVLVEGNPGLGGPISVVGSIKTGHAFLDDIAHNAAPAAGLTEDGDGAANPINLPRPAGTYDDELLDAHFITGDGRGNENIALTAVHVVFHSEHNRLANQIRTLIEDPGFGLTAAERAEYMRTAQQPGSPADPAGPNSGWTYGERLFQAARFVTEMQYQHLVFEEFARKLVPQINPFIVDGINFQSEINPAIPAEFAHAVYRLGHSMLTETVDRTNTNGSDNSIPLLTAFLNPLEFNDGGSAGQLTAAQAAGSIVQGTTQQLGNEIDEFVTDVLRNRLLGLPLDLATINLARGRSEGIPPLNEVRAVLYDTSGRIELLPYESWADFSFNLKHRQSLVNFLAAYGAHPTITAATTLDDRRAAAQAIIDGPLPGPDGVLGDDPDTIGINESLDDENTDSLDFLWSTGTWANQETGLNEIDLWVGGLAERQTPFGSLLGTTFNYIFEITLENLQNGDRFYYLERLDGLNLLVQLEGNSFSELIMRNTTATGLPADVFSRADLVFNMANLGTSGPILDDPTTTYDESADPDLVRLINGGIRYLGPAHVIWNGKDPVLNPSLSPIDRIISSEGDDTVRGNGGNDVMEGGAGNDQFLGGDGDDILTDTGGDDVIKGGNGNDAISSGPGIDLNQGGLGNDFIVAGSDGTETFGGQGTDFIYAGEAEDTVFGDQGDDWIEGGAMLDLLQGDQGNQFQDDPNGGHDVISGGGGDDDYDAEGGDDVMIVDSIGTERAEGMLGFDWATYRGDPLPVDADLDISIFQLPDINELRDRFDRTEALSGYNRNDILRGDDRDATLAADAEGTLIGHELTAAGVARITGLSAILVGTPLPYAAGNIILGGEGSDLLEGRGGNDILDGDRWLNAQLSQGGNFYNTMAGLRTAVFNGQVNPGTITIVRSLVTPTVPADCLAASPLNCDTALFSGNRAEYTITNNGNGSFTVAHTAPAGNLDDGVDILWNMERVDFADTAPIPVGNLLNVAATGAPTLTAAVLRQDTPITASTAGIADGNGLGAFSFVWQQSAVGGGGAFTNIAGATTASLTPGAAQVNRRVRVIVSFTDGGGFAESLTSAASDIIGANFIGGGAGETFNGNAGSDSAQGNGGADTLNMAGGNDFASGGAGGDTLNGAAGNDTLNGDAANDTISGGAGNDIIDGGAGADDISGNADSDTINGGAGNDTMNGGAGNDTFIFTTGMNNDTIDGFDNNPTGGQDLMNITGLGVTAGTFGARVTIAAAGGGRTLITIRNGAGTVLGTINLNGGPANYSITDFIF